MRHIPNALCVLRLVLAPWCAVRIVAGDYSGAMLLFFIAGWSDFFDGWLARKFDWGSPFGTYLDPIADKVLMAVTFIALGAASAVPWWLVVLIFGRDVMILLGVAVLYSRVKQRKFPPSLAGKISTTLQILAAGFVMMAKAGWIAAWWIPLAIASTTAGTAWSGIDYVIRARTMLGRKLPNS